MKAIKAWPSSKNMQWCNVYHLCILKELMSLVDTFWHFPVKHRWYPVTIRFQPATKISTTKHSTGFHYPIPVSNKGPLVTPGVRVHCSVLNSCCHLTPGWILPRVLSRPSVFTAHAQTDLNPRVFSGRSWLSPRAVPSSKPAPERGRKVLQCFQWKELELREHHRHSPVWRWRAAEPGRKLLGDL